MGIRYGKGDWSYNYQYYYTIIFNSMSIQFQVDVGVDEIQFNQCRDDNHTQIYRVE